jgi:zinc D-Ala-D-Ala carboxypeptidase
MVREFVEALDILRGEFGRPLRVTSGYRCPKHNAAESTTGLDGPHTTGRAVDLAVCGQEAFALVKLAAARGFTGIGVKQHGPMHKRFVHLDNLPAAAARARPRIWTYP